VSPTPDVPVPDEPRLPEPKAPPMTFGAQLAGCGFLLLTVLGLLLVWSGGVEPTSPAGTPGASGPTRTPTASATPGQPTVTVMPQPPTG